MLANVVRVRVRGSRRVTCFRGFGCGLVLWASFNGLESWLVSGAKCSGFRALPRKLVQSKRSARNPNISRGLPGDIIQLTSSCGQENPHDCLNGDTACHSCGKLCNSLEIQDTTLPNSKGKTSTKTKPHIQKCSKQQYDSLNFHSLLHSAPQ